MVIADVNVYSSYANAKMRSHQPNEGEGRMPGKQTVDTDRVEKNMLPVGACGLKVQFCFLDSSWEQLAKTAVFRNGNVTIDAAIIDDCATVPHEVLSKVLDVVYVGVYGTDSGRDIAIPTIWTQLGTVAGAARPSGKSSSPAAQPYWVQIKEQVDALQNEMMDREDLENALAQAKESGEFDGYTPIKGVDYFDGAKGDKGEQGEKGLDAPVIVCDAYGDGIAINDSTERNLHGLNLCGKTTQNGTPTPDAPVEPESVGDGGSIGVTVCGKNLIPYPYDGAASGGTYTHNGITYTDNGDGSVTANGTATALSSFNFKAYAQKPLLCGMTLGKSYRLTGCPGGASKDSYSLSVCFRNGSSTLSGSRMYDIGDGITFDTSPFAAADRCQVVIMVEAGVTVENVTFKPMLCSAEFTDDTYELYKEQTLTIQTPNGLAGIPVTSGGSYTDENGQQWACDEIDFARGKYVQRVGSIASYSGEAIAGSFISTTGSLAAGAKVLYILDAPIEADLTAEELAAYSPLHTNYPNTTIYNDAGAGMAVKYVADTKLYIDKKFAELEKTVVNNS